MTITGTTDLGDGLLAVTVNHDPTTVATDAPIGSLINQYGTRNWFMKLDNGSTTNVQIWAEVGLETAFEPNGFPNHTDSVVTWTDGTKTLSIAPAVTSFDVWVRGTKFTKSSTESVVGDGTDFTIAEGLWYFYYDSSGDLVASQTLWDLSQVAPVFMISWDATNSKAIRELEERHFLPMDHETHTNLHLTRGTQFITGLLPGNILADQSGALDTHAQLSITNGQILDENILFDIIDGSPQDLAIPAQLPVLYKTGAGGLWRADTANDFPVKRFGASRLAYNQFTGGAWQQTEAGNNNFICAHLFGMPDVKNPVATIQGEEEYGNISAARAGAEVELLALRTAGLPSAEWIPIATLIYQTSNGYGNTVKARIRTNDLGDDFVDWRGSGISPAVGQGPQGPAGVVPTYTTVVAAEAASASDNDLCYVVETETFYRYESSGAAYIDDNLYVLSTGDGGDTRWIGVSGQYTQGNISFQGQAYTPTFTLTDGVTITPNWNNGSIQSVVLGGNRTMANPSNKKDGATYILRIIQDAVTGSRTLTWGTDYKWPGGTAPTLSTATDAEDVVSIFCDGTNLYCSFLGDFS